MRHALPSAAAILLVAAFGGAAAQAANTCHAETLSCATTMPVGGYCECTAHGTTKSGTVIAKAPAQPKTNASAAGCGAHPGAPGCP